MWLTSNTQYQLQKVWMVSIFIMLSLRGSWILVCWSHEIMFLPSSHFILHIYNSPQKNSLNRTSVPPSPRLKEHVEEGAEKSSELDVEKICHKKMSTYDRALAPVDLVPLWLPEQDLQQVCPCQHFNQEERGFIGLHLFLRDYWQSMVSGEKGVTFFSGIILTVSHAS